MLHTSMGRSAPNRWRQTKEGHHALSSTHRTTGRTDHRHIAVHPPDAPHHLPRGGHQRRDRRRTFALAQIPAPRDPRTGGLLHAGHSSGLDAALAPRPAAGLHPLDGHRPAGGYRNRPDVPDVRGMAREALQIPRQQERRQAVQRIRLRPAARHGLRPLRGPGPHGDHGGRIDRTDRAGHRGARRLLRDRRRHPPLLLRSGRPRSHGTGQGVPQAPARHPHRRGRGHARAVRRTGLQSARGPATPDPRLHILAPEVHGQTPQQGRPGVPGRRRHPPRLREAAGRRGNRRPAQHAPRQAAPNHAAGLPAATTTPS